MKNSLATNPAILQNQIEMLFRNAPTTYYITLFNTLVVFLVLREYIDADYIFFWFCALAFLILLRILVATIFWRHSEDPRRSQKLYYFYLVLMHCSALVWGLLVYLPLSSDIIWIHAFISFVIAGMAAGAMVTLSVSLLASIPYLVLILVPFSYYFLAFNTMPHQVMGIMALLYLLLLVRLAVEINRNIKSTIKIQSENEELYQFLKKASRDAFFQFLEKNNRQSRQ